MPSRKGGKKIVREPVQVYLDERDLTLLDELIARSALPKAELLRLGLRRLATEMLAEGGPGHSLTALIGVLDEADVPADLAARHDEYLYGPEPGDPRRS